MHCICGFATSNGNKMAQHLANCGLSTCYPSLEAANENAVKRNMLDMLGLVRRDGETSGEGAEMSDTVDASLDDNNELMQVAESGVQQHQHGEHQVHQQHHQMPPPETHVNIQANPQQQQNYMEQQSETGQQPDNVGHLSAQQPPAPIQFGEMEAAPVLIDPQQVQAAAEYTQVSVVQQHQQHQQQPYGMTGYGQSALSTDIDMPLIGELAEPNAPPTPQFLGEVHTPMFDAVAAAEQQHYHAQQQHHHHPQ